MIHKSRGALALGLCACLALGLLPATAGAGYFFGNVSSQEFSFLGGTPTKWEPGANTASVGPFGTPGGATWSVMGAGFFDVSGSDGAHVGNTQAITSLNVAGFSAANYAGIFNTALSQWGGVSGFTNMGQVADGGVNVGASQATGGHLGDIRIGAWELSSATTLAHAYQPGTEAVFGPGGTIAGDLHFDINRTWVDNALDISGNSQFDLYTVALHEFGHSLGLGHSNVVGSVMEPIYAGARRTFHADDLAGIQAIYGAGATNPIPEPGTMFLVGLGLAGLAGRVRRRKQA